MKLQSPICAMAGLAAVLSGLLAAAGVPAAGGEAPASGRADPPVVVIYKPPLLDESQAPSPEVTGGGEGQAAVQLLAPDHAGLTTVAQPTLYWYARTPGAVLFRLAPLDTPGAGPLLQVETGDSGSRGIQHLDLKQHEVSLQPGKAYLWSVAPVGAAGQPAPGPVASAVIERIEPGEGLGNRIKGSRGMDLVKVYASEGLWYDTLDEISTMIEASPEDGTLTAVRARLLDQAGLQDVAGG